MTYAPRFSDREWRLAYGVALRVLQAPDQAEDAAQEALLRAYRARDSYSGTARFESWLYRIAYTTALSQLRSPHHRHRRGAHDGAVLDALPSRDEPPDRVAEAAQLAQCMEGCLDNLRPLDRLAFTERFLNGATERELGELLGVSTNAAKQRAFRARRAVRQCVAASGIASRGGTR
ncbi:MAG: sigma-70 family RNA polymerase sigma factor [Deltaproteobacteria bacterium]|nr:MAG: sigma-70 family RNA polymerase sigma factor [Deltaproteobacteria bacterium]